MWFFLLTIYLHNNQGIIVREGSYGSKAACEKSIKSFHIRSSKDTVVNLIGYCTTEAELKSEGK